MKRLMQASGVLRLARTSRASAKPPAWVLALGQALTRVGMAAGERRSISRADGSGFEMKLFRNRQGARRYKLFVPQARPHRGLPLVVMLHGCGQSPDDFAAGTRMNRLAEEHGVLVAYPEQPASANAQGCWNWFRPENQRHGSGEPALIAGITRAVMRSQSVDPRRVYVAGLSAGGAMAATMAVLYPELYAAVGVHSGLPFAAASGIVSAIAAMRRGAPVSSCQGIAGASARGRAVPTIVFHGDDDATVHPGNGDQVLAQAIASERDRLAATIEQGEQAGGRTYSRTRYAGSTAPPRFEQWVVHGSGHAWSGGSAEGSFTDPRGPDASQAMLRFFLTHVRPVRRGG